MIIADRATGRAVDCSEMVADATAPGERAAYSDHRLAASAAKGDETADSDQAAPVVIAAPASADGATDRAVDCPEMATEETAPGEEMAADSGRRHAAAATVGLVETSTRTPVQTLHCCEGIL